MSLNLGFLLQALKHYFLMDRGDLLESFLDSAEDEMAKPQGQVSLPRLQTLMDLGKSPYITSFQALCQNPNKCSLQTLKPLGAVNVSKFSGEHPICCALDWWNDCRESFPTLHHKVSLLCLNSEHKGLHSIKVC